MYTTGRGAKLFGLENPPPELENADGDLPRDYSFNWNRRPLVNKLTKSIMILQYFVLFFFIIVVELIISCTVFVLWSWVSGQSGTRKIVRYEMNEIT